MGNGGRHDGERMCPGETSPCGMRHTPYGLKWIPLGIYVIYYFV